MRPSFACVSIALVGNPSHHALMPDWDLGRDLADTCVQLVNDERQRQGKWPLTHTPGIAWQAGEHAGWMAMTHQHAHSPEAFRPDQRENLWMGLGLSPQEMVHAAVRDWLTHAGHRDALLSEHAGRIGVGVHVQHILERNRHFLILVLRTGPF